MLPYFTLIEYLIFAKPIKDAINAASELFKKIKITEGDKRALIDELRENLGFCSVVLIDQVPIEDAISLISTKEYDRLNRSGYDFNKLQTKKIQFENAELKHALNAWEGKKTSELIDTVYTKLKIIKHQYPVAKNSNKKRWLVRVNNINKRIIGLITHISKN